jgi:peptidoglycan/LPS O-acetylase OafA/YrhL
VRHTIYPIWVFLAVAAAIACFAFAASQFRNGMGMIVAGAGSMMWTAFVARKGAEVRKVRDDAR